MQGISAEALLSLRADLMRFAALQLRHRETAEDMVQEAIEAALRNSSSFLGQSTLKTWVFVFETCLDHLPPAAGRVFMMREFLGFESDEICRQLGISTSNCHVILHRARLKLRACMDAGWGRPEGTTC